MNTLKTVIEKQDELLKEYYDDNITKNDFNNFFIWFNNQIILTKNWLNIEEDFAIFKVDMLNNSVPGRLIIENKRKYKGRLIMEKCIEKNIISFNKHNQYKHIARQYFYTDEYLNSLSLEEMILTDETITEKTYSKLTKNRNRPTKRTERDAWETLKSDSFKIDRNAATNFLLTSLIDKSLSGISKKELNKEKTKVILQSQIINDLYNKNIFAIEGEKTGRIFTNFTSLKSELRKFCTLNGKQLVSIDMKSSVPYFFSSYLHKHNPNSKQLEQLYNLVTNEDIYEWVLNQHNKDGVLTPINNMVDMEFNDIETGETFNHWVNDKQYVTERDEVKPFFMQYLYSGNRSRHSFHKIFVENFPELVDILKKSNKDLAAILMREESKIFISTVRKFKDKCLSVHDSLYFAEEDREEIEKELSKTLESNGYFGYELK